MTGPQVRLDPEPVIGKLTIPSRLHTGNALALVQERAGTWSQDYALLPCEEHGDCYDRTRWDYAYPGVWDGFAWGCSWKVQECIAPSEGNDCL